MGHSAIDMRKAVPSKPKSKLEPNPKAKHSAKPKPEPEKPVEKATKTRAKLPKGPNSGQFLDLGGGFKIAHKPGSGYSTFYRLVAEKGHFVEIVEALKTGKYDVNNSIDANKLLDKMMVPVDRLRDYCRADQYWKDHATKKTETLTLKAKEGDKQSKEQAKEILKNLTRCSDDGWKGNIDEMISTCVGYYSFLMEQRKEKKRKKEKAEKPEDKPNKNVKKFKDAGLVFRRFPLSSKGSNDSYVMMFPEKYIDQVKTAILVGRGINEDGEDKK